VQCGTTSHRIVPEFFSKSNRGKKNNISVKLIDLFFPYFKHGEFHGVTGYFNEYFDLEFILA